MTVTPTVFMTETITETPAGPLTTIESTQTTVRTSVVDATSSVVVTATVDGELICHPEHTQFFTVTKTVTVGEPEITPEASVLTKTTTFTLSETETETSLDTLAAQDASTKTGLATVTIYFSGDITTRFGTRTVTVTDAEETVLTLTEVTAVTLTEETTVTLPEEIEAVSTELSAVTITEENIVTITEESIVTLTDEAVIILTEEETLVATETIVQSSPLIGHELETSSVAELVTVTTDVIPVTQLITQTQTVTHFVTYTTIATIDGTEVEQPVTETAVQTELITKVEVVTVTRTHRAGATEFVTATRTLASASAWPALSTAHSALASLGNATWIAPRPSVSQFEMSGADGRKGDGNACMALAVAITALVVLL